MRPFSELFNVQCPSVFDIIMVIMNDDGDAAHPVAFYRYDALRGLSGSLLPPRYPSHQSRDT